MQWHAATGRGLSPPARGNPEAERVLALSRGAYPRLRGGTSGAPGRLRLARGLSPPARGNQRNTLPLFATCGPIPACAGEPAPCSSMPSESRAYPRLRGGTVTVSLRSRSGYGLSPPARGNRTLRRHHAHRHGPIPACAGEPFDAAKKSIGDAAYPRLRGGTSFTLILLFGLGGLSPPARGNLATVQPVGCVKGPIPACAGEPRHGPTGRLRERAYPRLRGGTLLHPFLLCLVKGLSPPARGNLVPAAAPATRPGPIPACAGEPVTLPEALRMTGAYPRLRGGTATIGESAPNVPGLSPPARGNRRRPHQCSVHLGPIPACAGEPRPS